MAQGEDDRTWHWLLANGTPITGDEWDLVAGLSAGTLAPNTYVWRRGWAEWSPANRLAELSAAIPAERREPTVEPKLDVTASIPPPLPANVPRRTRPAAPPKPPRKPSAQAFKTAAAQRAQLRPIGPAAVPPKAPAAASAPLPNPSSFGVLSPKSPISTAPPPAPNRGRDALPTIAEEEESSSTATLRPPGAVPPPPRGVPTAPMRQIPAPLFTEPERKPVLLTPVPAAFVPSTESSAPQHARPEEPKAELAKASEHTEPSVERASPERIAETQRVGAATDPALSVQRRNRASLAWLATPRTKYALIGLSLTSALLAIIVVILLLKRSNDAATAPDALEAGKRAATGDAAACTLKHPAARLAGAIERGVPTHVATVKGTSLVAVGFAGTRTRALGMILDPLALEGKTTFDDEDKSAVQNVVPLVAHGAPSFAVDREDAPLRFPRTVDAVPLFTVGMSDTGFARAVDGAVSTIWPSKLAEKITEPRVVTIGNELHGVVFRSGGLSGKILVGWFGADGRAKTPLVSVPGAPRFAGTPFAAGSGNEMLVVFAGRNAQNAPWRVHFSRVKSGAKPGHAQELAGFGAGGGAIAPSAAGLPGGRWLLQWTEGSLGRYQVRVQTLDHELRPIGDPVLASPKGASAGQGAIWAGDNPAVALFILTTAGRDELWGAALSCP